MTWGSIATDGEEIKAPFQWMLCRLPRGVALLGGGGMGLMLLTARQPPRRQWSGSQGETNCCESETSIAPIERMCYNR